MGNHVNPIADKKGVFYKYESKAYRSECSGCGKGYHSHRWQAHHVLPGVCFSGLSGFVQGCLDVTDFNINKPNSMAGMPTLKAFLMHFRTTERQSAENANQLARWDAIRTYATDLADFGAATVDPGNIPCHQPSGSYGHTQYNDDVAKTLKENVFDPLKDLGNQGEHPDFENVKAMLQAIADMYWNGLLARGAGPGGGAHVGVRDNFVNRNGSAASGWWKPMTMADIPGPPPAPPVMRLDKP
jgi:hypothetical protein